MAPESHRSRIVEFLRIDAPGNHRSILPRGALSPAVIILAVMIFTLAGLVIDGGRQLGARSRAVGYAQEAARVGAATIELNTADPKIDIPKATTAIAAFCAQVTANDPAVTTCAPTTLTAEEATISVTILNKTTFLGLIGKSTLRATGAGTAHAEQGVEKADDSPTIPPIFVSTGGDGPGAPISSTAVPPTLDVPCPPRWTIGSPTPTWTLDPIPFPASCTPSLPASPTPTDGEESSTPPSPTKRPTTKPTRTTKPPNPSTPPTRR
ncbi:Tad domain-containing protein [Kribbella sandramycini]|uniref:Flp pilus assembly protein TadG n=1 Tax=Kribbella sandramycini TaxID=60450 RepID=A0A841SGG3_9ACTN|nr:pilus assembly protein TadG-related protein [Kribbella sandramycini]MBB6569091.1 Flp pilus assembly protein TadG [Kribbella sandramycini]